MSIPPISSLQGIRDSLDTTMEECFIADAERLVSQRDSREILADAAHSMSLIFDKLSLGMFEESRLPRKQFSSLWEYLTQQPVRQKILAYKSIPSRVSYDVEYLLITENGKLRVATTKAERPNVSTFPPREHMYSAGSGGSWDMGFASVVCKRYRMLDECAEEELPFNYQEMLSILTDILNRFHTDLVKSHKKIA